MRFYNGTIGNIVFGPDSFPKGYDGFKFPPIDVAVTGPLTQEFKPLPKPPLTQEEKPLGLRPRSIAFGEYAGNRLQEILAAMGRYVADGKRIPVEWLNELDELNGELVP